MSEDNPVQSLATSENTKAKKLKREPAEIEVLCRLLTEDLKFKERNKKL